MTFPKLSKEEMTARLAPPSGKIRMVLDTDTYNEVDDQFALSYALMSPEKLSVEAVYAAPFSGTFFARLLNKDDVTVPMTFDLAEGLEQSYQEIIKIFGMLDQSPEGKVFRGSSEYMKNPDQPVYSDAARDLVKRAMASDDILYVVAIGEITNIASAILMEPEIIKKIIIVWLGGHPLYWPHTVEFNIGQDPIASQIIFNSGVPLVLVPCMAVASNLTTTAAELRENLMGKSRIGSYLSDIVIRQLSPQNAANMLNLFRLTYLKGTDDYRQSTEEGVPFGAMSPSRIIWDISTIGYMINPLWCPSTLVPSPILTDDLRWEMDPCRHLMRICNFVYRDGVFGDMFAKLSKAPK
ncbi:hypothetical protein A7X67_18505 [Clostridium sp. W14A]|nr:hypothetical protein A7X67_18505 [Clostridium sp. W14A]